MDLIYFAMYCISSGFEQIIKRFWHSLIDWRTFGTNHDLVRTYRRYLTLITSATTRHEVGPGFGSFKLAGN
jgi:hypothetical protein